MDLTSDEGARSPASAIARFFLQEDLNFLVTNRIPRRYATLLLGRFARIESRTLTRASIAIWRLFADDLRLDEAKEKEWTSLRACFIRELKEGARPIDPRAEMLTSPCDAVIGERGTVTRGRVFQAKGFPYSLDELFGDSILARAHEGDSYVTLRLKSNMYHRFHAPADAEVTRVRYISGDTWNVNPIALKRVERLFCRNERVIIEMRELFGAARLTLVPVASILVASLKLAFLKDKFDLRYGGPNVIHFDGVRVAKGQELGWFESGSTILLFADGSLEPAPYARVGTTIRVGQPLFRRKETRHD